MAWTPGPGSFIGTLKGAGILELEGAQTSGYLKRCEPGVRTPELFMEPGIPEVCF